MKTRTEKDFIGKKEIPVDAPWGIHTARALENFPIPGRPVPPQLISALAQIKKVCALANKELGYLDEKKADAAAKAKRSTAAKKAAATRKAKSKAKADKYYNKIDKNLDDEDAIRDILIDVLEDAQPNVSKRL